MKEKKTEKMLNYANGPSLEEINNTVEVPKNASFWRTLLAYSGPGALVAVGYMDPGNWITSIAGGAEYKYTLLSVILLSSLVAMLLQSMAARLGIVTGMDLAQATREHTSKRTGVALWVVTELAIMATDIAEVIGGAVALQLLFGFPLLIGVLITTFDVLLLLLLTKLGFRKIEAIVSCLIAVIFFVFAYEVALADPNVGEVLRGFIPDTKIATDKSMLFLALGIVGATVMPHNLYLHSSIAQARKFDRNDDAEKAKAIRFTTWDSNIQLTVAFVVNCLLLILGGALFYGTNSELGKFVDLFDALKNPDIVGNIVNDMTQALSFYQTLGFNVLGEASPDYTELQNNGVRISLNSLQMITGVYGFAPSQQGDKIELAFLCETAAEVDNTVKKMSQAGYIVFKEPWNAPWGQRYAIIKDVDANLISLFAPL